MQVIDPSLEHRRRNPIRFYGSASSMFFTILQSYRHSRTRKYLARTVENKIVYKWQKDRKLENGL